MIFVSYHNIDIAYAFQLSNLLIRFYRKVWLDRLEIDLNEDWKAKTREARARATHVIVVVTDEYLNTPYCRNEFEYFRNRGLALTAVIPRDFSTEMIASFTFSDWIDFRRRFDDPNDVSVENLLSQLPQSDAVEKTGERLDYLRGLVQDFELALAKMPTSWASLRNSAEAGADATRPRMVQPSMQWQFTAHKVGNSLPADNLLSWARDEPQFLIRGEAGSGKTYFARLLALQQAHAAMRDDGEALPIWLDLALWDHDQRDFDGFIESQWPLLTHWRHWLDQQPTYFVLDNFSDFASTRPAQVPELNQWIDASPEHRFAVVSGAAEGLESKLPAIEINRTTPALALNFASAYLTLDQQTSFRQILQQKSALIENGRIDNLSIGVELLSADRALAFNEWHKNPLPALIALRSKLLPAEDGGLDEKQILTDLQMLAWSITLQDNRRFLRRDSALTQSLDPRVIDRALDLGLLEERGALLRFQSELIQLFLAAEALKKDGLGKYLTRPSFAAGRGRIPGKWDQLALVLVSGLAEETRSRVIEQIAEIDPFLAAMCLQRHPEHYGELKEPVITELTQLCAQNPVAQSAFRSSVGGLPQAEQTAELLIQQLGRFGNAQQLWLWHEIRALPLELPLDFIQVIEDLDRDSREPVTEGLAPNSLSSSLAYLAKLSTHEDRRMRQNAIWMLGEIKYLPTAILLLDQLENGEADDQGEVVLALMKFAYSDLLARVLRWSLANPGQRQAVIGALAKRKRGVTSRLLSLAHERRLTLNPEFYDVVVNTEETDIAIGLAQIAAEAVNLPAAVETAIHTSSKADSLRARIARCIKHLPNREAFQQLLPAISDVLRDPPEPTIFAGSKIEALVYGQPLFDDVSAQAESAGSSALPAELKQQLRDRDPRQRQLALKQVTEYAAIDALPPLLEAARDENSVVRIAAYESLARFESEVSARQAVSVALSDADLAVVAAATDLLKAMPGAACDALIELLDSENPATVAAAVDILGSARYRPALGALGQLVEDARLAENHGLSIGQLARQARRAIESDPPPGDSVRTAPAAASESAGDGVSNAFSDEEKISRTLRVLRDDDWGRTQKAAKFLRKFARHLRGAESPQVLELLCDALQDENWSVRWAAAEALAVLRNGAAIPALAACLNDRSWIVQVAVLRALDELGAKGLASKTSPLLQSARQAVREAAAEALGEMGDRRAIPALAASLKVDADEFVRLAALKAICQIEPGSARPHLELALSDSSVHLRWFALQQLSPEMNESDLPILKQLLDDYEKPAWEKESLHELAVATLRRIDSPECRALLAAAALAGSRIDA
ncbi:MAG: HEAT repeat domain-containing protein [Chloroflexi bacterium]|nr:HEAT repeat domain-containing protein [Chloroflexota bacterium]